MYIILVSVHVHVLYRKIAILGWTFCVSLTLLNPLISLQLMTKSASRGASDGPHYPDPDEDLPLGEPPVEDEEEGVVGQKLAGELVRQQELYADLRRKTQQLKQLQQVRERGREERERGRKRREGKEREEEERGEGRRERGKGGERGVHVCMIGWVEEGEMKSGNYNSIWV